MKIRSFYQFVMYFQKLIIKLAVSAFRHQRSFCFVFGIVSEGIQVKNLYYNYVNI